jgi:hypothetical protein
MTPRKIMIGFLPVIGPRLLPIEDILAVLLEGAEAYV